MKKLSMVLMILLLMFSLMACQNSETSQNNEPIAEVTEETTSQENSTSAGGEEEKEEVVEEVFPYDYEVLSREVIVSKDTVTFVDASGEEVTVKKSPTRVIGLLNSYNDLWYHCGGDLVGRIDSETGLPEAFIDAEIVGSITEPNIEKILELNPDLVILRYSKQKEIINILVENDIDYIAMEYNSFEDYLKMVKIFAEVNNKPNLYQTLGMDVKNEIIEVINNVPEEKKSALLIFGTSRSFKAFLSTTTNGQMLNQLGVVNIAEGFGGIEEGATSVELSMEKILELDPDYILVQSMSSIEKVQSNLKENLESDPAWGSLSAVKNGKYIFLDRALFHYKPNEQYAEAYRQLAKIVYPESFE